MVIFMKRLIIFCACWILAAKVWAADPYIHKDGILLENPDVPGLEPGTNSVYSRTVYSAPFVMSESVFTIKTFDRSGNLSGIASATVLKPGIAVTCFHVIRDAWRTTGRLGNGKEVEFVEYMSPVLNKDICLLRYQPTTEGLGVCLASTKNAIECEKIYTIGAPEGFGHTIAEGIISAFREIPGYGMTIQITAPISQGSSGGALLDHRAYLLGIISFMWRDGQNLNFAIPNDVILDEVKYFKTHPEAMVSFSYWRK